MYEPAFKRGSPANLRYRFRFQGDGKRDGHRTRNSVLEEWPIVGVRGFGRVPGWGRRTMSGQVFRPRGRALETTFRPDRAPVSGALNALDWHFAMSCHTGNAKRLIF